MQIFFSEKFFLGQTEINRLKTPETWIHFPPFTTFHHVPYPIRLIFIVYSLRNPPPVFAGQNREIIRSSQVLLPLLYPVKVPFHGEFCPCLLFLVLPT